MTFDLGSTMRVIQPHPNVIAFYDGRVPGVLAYSDAPNWLDDGAFQLGCCAYAVVNGSEALLFDTHISVPHARLMRKALEARGVTHMRVVLSHAHPDHIAGLGVFLDCEIIVNSLTAKFLVATREALGRRMPPVEPQAPTIAFDGSCTVWVGDLPVTLRQVDIHTEDGTVAILPDGTTLAGDILEDSVTYVAEPGRLRQHLKSLDELKSWPITRILPSHGSVEQISAGGYDLRFIEATRLYVEKLLSVRSRPELATQPLSEFGAEGFATGGAAYFQPYEDVHKRNVAAVLALPDGE